MAAADQDTPRRLVFLGPPNSGKGTQAVRLATTLRIPAISTGEMLRSAVAAGNALGRRVEDVMNAGLLVDDGLMAELVEARLAQPDTARGFLLDGYPRTLPQVETLDAILERQGKSLDHVVMIDAPESVLIPRAIGRGRPDDTEEIVRERLTEYRAKTEPLVDHYRQRTLLREVDGNQTMDEVERCILAAVEG